MKNAKGGTTTSTSRDVTYWDDSATAFLLRQSFSVALAHTDTRTRTHAQHTTHTHTTHTTHAPTLNNSSSHNSANSFKNSTFHSSFVTCDGYITCVGCFYVTCASSHSEQRSSPFAVGVGGGANSNTRANTRCHAKHTILLSSTTAALTQCTRSLLEVLLRC